MKESDKKDKNIYGTIQCTNNDYLLKDNKYDNSNAENDKISNKEIDYDSKDSLLTKDYKA